MSKASEYCARNFLKLLAIYCLLFSIPAAAHDHEDDEQDHAELLGVIGGTHLGGTLGALIPEPTVAFVNETIAYASHVTLKFMPASFIEPSDVSEYPNSSDQCTFDFTLPQGEAVYSNIFGLQNPLNPFVNDWGALGAPSIFHFNTEVGISVHNQHLRPGFVARRAINMPAGNHTINWRADTIADQGLDLVLPTAMMMMSYSKFKAAKSAPAAAAGNADEAAKQAGFFKRAGKWMIEKLELAVRSGANKALDIYIQGLIDDATDWEFVTATKEYDQQFTVYDLVPPVISYDAADQVNNATLPTITLEATDFGGVALHRVIDQLRARTTSYDPCGRSAGLAHNLPDLIRLGTTQAVWTSRDSGPTPSGTPNTVRAFQSIVVEDTQAPLMITPPGKVIEIDPAQASQVAAEEVVLGTPRVVDLADPAPQVFSDAPDFFPIDSRTPVTWTVRDQSGNENSGEQLITVKEHGTNTAPTVQDVEALTLTSAPVDIVLRGADEDMLDGVFDPLAINLESRPQNGDFVAPLLPYFIEDFRTTPAGPYGEEFGFLTTHNARDDWLYENICNNPDYFHINSNDRISKAWVYAPKFIHVQDDGTYFLIDSYWQCDMPGTRAETEERISKWSADNEFLGQIQYGGTSDTFVMDDDDFMYQLSRGGNGTGTYLTLTQLFTNFEDGTSPGGSTFTGDDWRFDFASTSNPNTGVSHFVNPESLSYARVDSRNQLIFVTDRRRVFVFDVREDFSDGELQNGGAMRNKYLGALHDGEQFLCNNGSHGNSWTGFAMEVDSEGGLYVTDTCDNQIHKFAPSYFDEEGEFVMGEHVGWLGRCDSSSNNACDVDNGRSRGYACQDDTCVLPDRRLVDGLNRLGSWGDAPGQFAGPVFIDLDPNDVLYVGDSGRVQRFAKDGTFGGQAKSTGTGINQGDAPGFVLGNMGTVKAVTVNSTNFFVVDQAESFIHVFETTPLKDITDDSATVTYVSDFSFHGGTDTFTFSATDGLATSSIGTVNVQVNRNYRPPEAFDREVTTDEDESVDITLMGDDPDGVIGTDDVFPLDRLTFAVAEQPEFGSLQISNDIATYTPNADFHGTDVFHYVANDGQEDSPPARVSITVESVDDLPVLTAVTRSNRAGRGFPVVVMAEYVDDGGPTAADAFTDWGDGAVDSQGDFYDPDGPEGEGPPQLTGTKINEPVQGIGEGNLLAKHTYDAVGSNQLQVCLNTDGVTNVCEEQTVVVSDLVSLALTIGEDPDETTNSFIDIDVRLENAQPEGWSGLNADAVTMQQIDVPEVNVTQILSQTGQCGLAGGALTCADSRMAPGDLIEATVRLALVDSGPLIYDLGVPFALDADTSTAAIEDLYTSVRWITFVADPSDTDMDGMTDVFEQFFGLNPNSAADANVDPDGDGLTNFEEYETRTDPNLSDTDGDGVSDRHDECPTDPGGSVGGPGGICEAEIQSSPILRIIQILSERER